MKIGSSRLKEGRYLSYTLHIKQKIFFIELSKKIESSYRKEPPSPRRSQISVLLTNLRVIPYEITHSTNVIVFILSTQSVHPMNVHNPEYQSPVTSGSGVTEYANFVN